jgi:hypothetical protein
MKRVVIGAALLVGAFAVLRRIGPALGERAMKKCEEMFDRMPEDSPPKRMMRGIDDIRDQNSRILHHLEQRDEDRLFAAAN